MEAHKMNVTLPEKPGVTLTVSEYGALHNLSISVVKKQIKQGRLPSRRVGGGAKRVGAVLVLTDERAPQLAPGALSEAQRRAWNRGRS
jgi:hypothetical protein